ncbi:MAG: hypothetical protein SOU50_02575, partial [Oscillospiraceae bacterium]|nr:hypothetical protein [Oscillospiraceae bacterium]
LHAICLQIFRHIAQKFLAGRQPACEISIQSDKKSDGASCAQALCGVALIPDKSVDKKSVQKPYIQVLA